MQKGRQTTRIKEPTFFRLLRALEKVDSCVSSLAALRVKMLENLRSLKLRVRLWMNSDERKVRTKIKEERRRADLRDIARRLERTFE